MSETTVNSAFHVRFTKGYELIQSYPNYVPIMFVTSKDVQLETDTIMSPKNASLCNVIMQFRKSLITDVEKSSTIGFIFYVKSEDGKNVLPNMTEKVGDLHDRFRWSDMWLRVQIEKEDIFG